MSIIAGPSEPWTTSPLGLGSDDIQASIGIFDADGVDPWTPGPWLPADLQPKLSVLIYRKWTGTAWDRISNEAAGCSVFPR